MSLKNLSFHIFYITILLSNVSCLESEKILGGDNAEVGRFTYQVTIYRNGDNVCGGGILDDYHVLTAAHCVIGKDNQFRSEIFMVVAGIYNLHEYTDRRVVTGVKMIFVPTLFKRSLEYDDIAILELVDSLDLERNTHLSKLDLPHPHRDYYGKTAEIAGFGWQWVELYDYDYGMSAEVGDTYDYRMKYVKVRILRNSECIDTNFRQKILPRLLCGKTLMYAGIKEGVCSGDSGGPLVVDNTVVGILSTSPDLCDESEESALYTRVSKYLTIIESAKNREINLNMRSHVVPEERRYRREHNNEVMNRFNRDVSYSSILV